MPSVTDTPIIAVEHLTLGYDGTPVLHVAAAPADGKANADVERVLSRLLGAHVRVVRGQTSRTKVIEVDVAPAVLEERLIGVFGPL